MVARRLAGSQEARAKRGAWELEKDLRRQRRAERRELEADGDLRAGDAIQRLTGLRPKPRDYAHSPEESEAKSERVAVIGLADRAQHRGLCLSCGALDAALRASGMAVTREPCDMNEEGCPGVGG